MKKTITFLLLLLCLPVFSQSWKSFTPGATNGFVTNLMYHDSSLYASGFFTSIGGVKANYIARWDGSSWQPLGTGLNYWGHEMLSFNHDLYAGRYTDNTEKINYVMKWDGTAWSKVGSGFTLPQGAALKTNIYTIDVYAGKLITTGEFTKAGNKTVNGVAIWNGNDWDSLGSGFNTPMPIGPVLYPHALLIFNGDPIVGGNFIKAGNTVVNGISRWNGTSWVPMGEGFNNAVYGLGIYNGELYACGEFTMSGSTPAGRIAKWNGSSWINAGIDANNWVHTIRQIGQEMYISGGFLKATPKGGNPITCNRIMKFNGTTWSNMGSGLDNDVEAIIEYQGKILAGGDFSTAGGNTASRLALFDSTKIVSKIENEVTESSPVRLFPNPSQGESYMSFTTAHASHVSAEISDMNGRLLFHQEGFYPAGAQQIKLNLESLSPGTYILRTIFEGKICRNLLVIR